MTPLRHAFKEWAVVCRALALGRQTLILRKGGIAEGGGAFRLEHERFWLYPTFVHQQIDGIVPEARPLLEQALAGKPPAGTLRLTCFAEVGAAWQLSDLAAVEPLAGMHCWSAETVRARFAYRRPGLFVLAVRVFAVPRAIDLPEAPAYAGCKSWVELEQDAPAEGSVAVLDDAAFAAALHTLHGLLASGGGRTPCILEGRPL
jgi:hypothetical protein